MRKMRIHSVPSAFGGEDFYDDDGTFVGYSVPSAFGGSDFYGVNGETGYSVPSAFGGSDYQFDDAPDTPDDNR